MTFELQYSQFHVMIIIGNLTSYVLHDITV